MKLRNLLLCAVLLATLPGCSLRTHRYLFVVPEQLPTGADSTPQRAELETWLTEKAGGFTEIDGVRGGWKAPDGAVVTEENRLYLVTYKGRPRPFRKELNRRIKEDFQQEEAWIERW